MEFGLASVNTGYTFFCDVGVLFQRKRDFLIAPFWHRGGDAEFDGVTGVGIHDDIAATWDVALVPG